MEYGRNDRWTDKRNGADDEGELDASKAPSLETIRAAVQRIDCLSLTPAELLQLAVQLRELTLEAIDAAPQSGLSRECLERMYQIWQELGASSSA